MIKIFQRLTRNRLLVLLLLASPLALVLFDPNFRFSNIPHSPFPRFSIVFEVPNRTATEIEVKVTQPAEKIFNGLPSLISLESKTEDERATFSMIFSESLSRDHAYLFIQEKMDQAKLAVSSDVKTIEVRQELSQRPADIEFQFSEPVSANALYRSLAKLESYIVDSSPKIDHGVEIYVSPRLKDMYGNGISLSQLKASLQLQGLVTSVGRSNQISFEIGKKFSDLEEIESVVVGVKGHRPIMLSDVADVRFSRSPQVDRLSLWTNARADSTAIEEAVAEFRPSSVNYPELELNGVQAFQPLLGIILLIIIQTFFFRALFGTSFPIRSVLIYFFLIVAHFVFWKNMFFQSVSSIDLNALLLSLLVGGLFWLGFLCRVRSFFYQNPKVQRPPKTIPQATLLAQVELIPTFVFALVALALYQYPILRTAVNIPSRLMLESFFFTGVPVILMITLIMPVLLPLDWLERSFETSSLRFRDAVSTPVLALTFLISLVCIGINPLLFNQLPLGVKGELESPTGRQMADLRGYEDRLKWLGDTSGSLSYEPIHKSRYVPYYSMTTSLSGLRFLPDLDLIGFSSALADFQAGAEMGRIGLGEGAIPVKLDFTSVRWSDLDHLLIGAKSQEDLAKPLHVLNHTTFEMRPDSIFRSQMQAQDVWQGRGIRDLKWKPEKLGPTDWTNFVAGQIEEFEYHFLTVGVFFSIFASLYLNSFVRGFSLFLIQQIPFLLFLAGQSIFGTVYHVDSLWLFPLGAWISMLLILIPTRVVDVERTRGIERDVAFDEVRVTLLPPLLFGAIWVVACVAIIGTLDWVPGLANLGLWAEALVAAAVMAPVLVLSLWVFFPLFYKSTEEFIDSALFSWRKRFF